MKKINNIFKIINNELLKCLIESSNNLTDMDKILINIIYNNYDKLKKLNNLLNNSLNI